MTIDDHYRAFAAGFCECSAGFSPGCGNCLVANSSQSLRMPIEVMRSKCQRA
jgi:hypothetical protein